MKRAWIVSIGPLAMMVGVSACNAPPAASAASDTTPSVPSAPSAAPADTSPPPIASAAPSASPAPSASASPTSQAIGCSDGGLIFVDRPAPKAAAADAGAPTNGCAIVWQPRAAYRACYDVARKAKPPSRDVISFAVAVKLDGSGHATAVEVARRVDSTDKSVENDAEKKLLECVRGAVPKDAAYPSGIGEVDVSIEFVRGAKPANKPAKP